MAGALYDYKNSKVLITGGSNGIGLATARAFHKAGAEVSITGRKGNPKDYPHDLTSFQYHQLDLSDEQATKKICEGLDGLDILIANAGGIAGENEFTPDGFKKAVDVNLVSVFRLAHYCLPHLQKSQFEGGASVVGIASLTSYFGYEWAFGYGAAKGGLVQLIKGLAVSWGKHNIRANGVGVGFTKTELTKAAFDIEGFAEGQIARQSIKRTGVPEDIAPAILFLTSPQASWITGQTLPVDGGYTITM